MFIRYVANDGTSTPVDAKWTDGNPGWVYWYEPYAFVCGTSTCLLGRSGATDTQLTALDGTKKKMLTTTRRTLGAVWTGTKYLVAMADLVSSKVYLTTLDESGAYGTDHELAPAPSPFASHNFRLAWNGSEAAAIFLAIGASDPRLQRFSADGTLLGSTVVVPTAPLVDFAIAPRASGWAVAIISSSGIAISLRDAALNATKTLTFALPPSVGSIDVAQVGSQTWAVFGTNITGVRIDASGTVLDVPPKTLTSTLSGSGDTPLRLHPGEMAPCSIHHREAVVLGGDMSPTKTSNT